MTRCETPAGKPAMLPLRSQRSGERRLQAIKMTAVYRLRSVPNPEQGYTGLTDDLSARLKKHNEGGVPSTASFKPWRVESAHAFASREKAVAFERYLKTGSGREFARRHF